MKKILLIENDASYCNYIRELLEDFGYKTAVAENGREGIKIARLAMPDLIICSTELSEPDGYSVFDEINKSPETGATPFIFFAPAGKSGIEEFRRAMDLGVDDFLIKPVRSGHLLKVIETRLKKVDRIMEKQESLTKKNNKNNSFKKLTSDDRLFLMVGNHPEIIKINKIVFITAAEEYSNVYTTDARHLLVQKLLKEWEKTLPSKVFLRIHRSTIINLDYVKKVEKWFNHSFRVYLEDVSEPFIISRRYSTRLRALLNTSKR
ncbi:MAG: response regulator transcription factor [Ignavibacteria bacterium]|jgi:DNA-binding LytR/AlgR family response regulator|nr:response regulator transcription factor [Ignavibacteria bacterium]MCU7505203.1 response regulator transcription factor [Ignavibacteria bacterium]MCU7518106.1 response regulator transcription factor [Ignavibacteria bacterium]